MPSTRNRWGSPTLLLRPSRIFPDPHEVNIPATTDESNTLYDVGEIKVKMGRRLNASIKNESLSQPTPTPTISNDTKTNPQTGSVHGRVLIGKEPASGVHIDYWRSPLRFNVIEPSAQVSTNSEGYFTVKNLLPGKYQFARTMPSEVSTPNGSMVSRTHSHGVNVEVIPGETIELTIGGTGRQVIGQLIPEANDKGVPLGLESLSTRGITPKKTKFEEDRLLELSPYSTDLMMEVGADGKFTIPDVPPGEYSLALNYFSGTHMVTSRQVQVRANPSSFTIPEASPGHEDEPYDVGTIKVRLANEPPKIDRSEQKPGRGSVRGQVINTVTGDPIKGAFVAIDHSGDAGGANLERFQEEGIYATAETDVDGAFTLTNVAFDNNHPLYVTHTGFVRHSSAVALSEAQREVTLDIYLQPGGWLSGKIVDTNRQPLSGPFGLRLTATDGRTFPPLREDWPTFAFRTEKTGMDGSFRIGELDDGAFTLEAYRQPSPSQVDFFGSVSDVKVQAGATAEIQISPIVSSGTIEVQLKTSGTPTFSPFAVISRNMDLIELAGGPFHPEDERLGRVLSGSLFRLSFDSEGKAVFGEFPPGEYAVFTMRNTPAGEGTAAGAVSIEGRRIEVKAGSVTPVRFEESQ